MNFTDYELDLNLDQDGPRRNLLEQVRSGEIKCLNDYISKKVDTIPDNIVVLLSKVKSAEDNNILFSVQLSWMFDFYTASRESVVN